MKRLSATLLVLGGSLALGGCVAGLAASAVSMAARSAQKPQVNNEHLKPAAREACTARAAQLGAVTVIDVQQYSPSRIIVWGTVAAATGRQSFECQFGQAITAFKLRPIPAG